MIESGRPSVGAWLGFIARITYEEETDGTI